MKDTVTLNILEYNRLRDFVSAIVNALNKNKNCIINSDTIFTRDGYLSVEFFTENEYIKKLEIYNDELKEKYNFSQELIGRLECRITHLEGTIDNLKSKSFFKKLFNL